MTPLLILSYAVQAALIVHCIKTGRNQLWIWVLILLPGVGAIAYVAVELIPGLLRGRAAQRTARGLKKVMDPGADLRRYESEVRVAGNVASRQRYAEELIKHGRYDEAIQQYREALSGLYEHDPNLMLGLAPGTVRQGRRTRRARDIGRTHTPESGFPLTDGTPAVRACPGSGGRRAEGTGGVPGAGALVSGRGGSGALCTAADVTGTARAGAAGGP